jgi:hypothetical protein
MGCGKKKFRNTPLVNNPVCTENRLSIKNDLSKTLCSFLDLYEHLDTSKISPRWMPIVFQTVQKER